MNNQLFVIVESKSTDESSGCISNVACVKYNFELPSGTQVTHVHLSNEKAATYTQLPTVWEEICNSNRGQLQQSPQRPVIQQQNQLQHQLLSSNQSYTSPTHFCIEYFIKPIYQDKDFPDLPFIKIIDSLFKPIHCKINNFNIFDITKFYYLKEDFSINIPDSWDFIKKQYKIQIILRLEQVGHTETVTGHLPSNIQVFVNNFECKLPKLNYSRVSGITPWRLNVPIDITNLTNYNKNIKNTLKITWSDDPRTYAVGVFLSKIYTWEDQLAEIKKRPMRRSKKTIEFIKNSMKNDGDLNVNYLNVTIKDPFSSQKMELPAKGINCVHLQCFDTIKFLQMNEQKQKWLCPICKKQVKFENIVIDEYFLTIVEGSSENCENVILFKDGTWTENNTKMHKKNISVSNRTEIISIDSDEDSSEDNNANNKEFEPKSKRPKCNSPKKKKKKSEHNVITTKLTKTNANSSTKKEFIKNTSIPSVLDNSNMSNFKPGSSTNLTNIICNSNCKTSTSDRNKSKKIQEKAKSRSVLFVITLD